MWQIRSKTATVFLLGSIHYLPKDAYPLNKKIEDAFRKANVLAVEANIINPDQLFFTKFIESAFYPEGDSLEKHLPENTYRLVLKQFDEFGLPAGLIQREKPWFLALTLTSLELLKAGFDPNLGIDMHFLSNAGKRRIVELESLDFQTRLLAGLSDAEQASFLLFSIKELHTMGKESENIVTAWKSGDAQEMESLLSKGMAKEPGMSSVWDKLLYERNRNMVLKIEDFLKTNDTCFMVVGAGHLVGERGIVEMLRARGYSVEQR
ncbi:MAG: TraB/GumN family protein [Acidobacteriota bacterium]